MKTILLYNKRLQITAQEERALRIIRKKKFVARKDDFKERKGDSYRTVAIHAKRARGMMVDFAVRNRVQTVTELQKFQEAAYAFRPELSKKDHYCFTREMS